MGLSLFEAGDAHIGNIRFLVNIWHLLGQVTFVEHFFLTGLTQLEVLAFHFLHLVFDSVGLESNSVHFFMGILKLVFHLFHLPCFLLQGFFVFDQLVVDLGAGLSRQDIFEFEEEFLFLADEVLLGFNFLCFWDESSR